MARTPSTRDDEPSDAGTPVRGVTIVGGRPAEEGRGLSRVPTGIQRLLRLASVDEQFLRELVKHRAEAAKAAAVALTASEVALLAAIPVEQLERVAGQMPPPTPPVS